MAIHVSHPDHGRADAAAADNKGLDVASLQTARRRSIGLWWALAAGQPPTANRQLTSVAAVHLCLLDELTSPRTATILTSLKATLLVRNRIAHGEELFAELVVWIVPAPLVGSAHHYKYRLSFVAHGGCGLRYDNEAGKGDHRHWRDSETRYRFSSLDKLFSDFEGDIRRYLHENRHP